MLAGGGDSWKVDVTASVSFLITVCALIIAASDVNVCCNNAAATASASMSAPSLSAPPNGTITPSTSRNMIPGSGSGSGAPTAAPPLSSTPATAASGDTASAAAVTFDTSRVSFFGRLPALFSPRVPRDVAGGGGLQRGESGCVAEEVGQAGGSAALHLHVFRLEQSSEHGRDTHFEARRRVVS